MAEVAAPIPGPNQVVIDVAHVSLNHGDLNDARPGRIPAGGVLSSDAAGVVGQAARIARGPGVGTRVVALAQGVFAERVAVASPLSRRFPALATSFRASWGHPAHPVLIYIAFSAGSQAF